MFKLRYHLNLRLDSRDHFLYGHRNRTNELFDRLQLRLYHPHIGVYCLCSTVVKGLLAFRQYDTNEDLQIKVGETDLKFHKVRYLETIEITISGV